MHESCATDHSHGVKQEHIGRAVEARARRQMRAGRGENNAARAHQAYIANETLATQVSYERFDAEPVMIDDRPLQIGVALAS